MPKYKQVTQSKPATARQRPAVEAVKRRGGGVGTRWRGVMRQSSHDVFKSVAEWTPAEQPHRAFEMGGCTASKLAQLPFDMAGLERTFITREQPVQSMRVLPFKMVPAGDEKLARPDEEKLPVNIAYMRARFCEVLSSLKSHTPLLKRLKLVLGAGVVRGLLPAEQFVGFPRAVETSLGLGLEQVLCAVLRAPEHVVLAYTLDGMVSQLHAHTPLRCHGFQAMHTDVVPSRVCGGGGAGGGGGDGDGDGDGDGAAITMLGGIAAAAEGNDDDALIFDDNAAEAMPAEGVRDDGALVFADAEKKGDSAAAPTEEAAPPKGAEAVPVRRRRGGAHAPRDVYTYDPDRFGVPLKALRRAVSLPAVHMAPVKAVEIVLYQSAAKQTWFLLGARLSEASEELQPYLKTRDLELMDTQFPLLPSFLPLNHPGMSVFFAGTRYDALSQRAFAEVRKSMGTIVAACTATPSFTDVLLALQSFPLFMHSKMYESYRAFEGLRRVLNLFKALDDMLHFFAQHLTEAFAAGKEPELISTEAYDALRDATPLEAYMQLETAAFTRKSGGTAAPPQFIVYGRYKPAIASGLRPCAFTERAVAALTAAGMAHEVVEVVSATDYIVPISKPASHTTVPVVFVKYGEVPSDDMVQFIGGFTELSDFLKALPPPPPP